MARTMQSGGHGGKRGKLPSKLPAALAALAPGGKGKTVPPKKKHRFKPGTKALREIRKYQRSYDLLTKKAQIRRHIRDVSTRARVMPVHQFVDENGNPKTPRWSGEAMDMVQAAGEAYLISVMEEGMLCCIHRGRITVQPRDIQLSRRCRREVA